MQTFLPYEDFAQSAAALDRQRLGKQRVETLQVLNTLLGKSEGWKSSPVTKMWHGYEVALGIYGITVCAEWRSRGYKDTCTAKLTELTLEAIRVSSLPWLPPWLGDPRLHLSHQSNLVRKMPERYQPMWPDIGPDLAYFWPSKEI